MKMSSLVLISSWKVSPFMYFKFGLYTSQTYTNGWTPPVDILVHQDHRTRILRNISALWTAFSSVLVSIQE